MELLCDHLRLKDHCSICLATALDQNKELRVVPYMFEERRVSYKESIHMAIARMLKLAKHRDMKNHRYDETNFVTYGDVLDLIQDADSVCTNCGHFIQFVSHLMNYGTLDTVDKVLGHVTGNCVVVCRMCCLASMKKK